MASQVYGWAETVQISAGVVNADGSFNSGNNFVPVKQGTGTYTIVFTPPFGGRPTLLVTQWYPGGGDPRDNAVVVAVQPNQAIIETGDSGGSAGARNFSFIALGPQGDQPITAKIGLYQGSISSSAGITSAAAGAFSSASVDGNSIYTINVNVPFSYIPAVVAKQSNDSDPTNNTRDNVVVTSIATNKVQIKTGDSNGKNSNRPFEFILAAAVNGTPARTIGKLIYGSLNNDGSIKSGFNFDTVVISKGKRAVVPLTPFSQRPTAVAVQNYPGTDVLNAGGAGNTTDNVVLGLINAKSFEFVTGDNNGNAQDRFAEFIALY